MINGSCFCKKVQFTIKNKIPPPWNCYCNYCCKLHGSAFTTHTVINKKYFSWSGGFEYVKKCESSPQNYRHFCGECGSQLAVINDNEPETIVVVYAALDENTLPRPIGNLFVQSKMSWAVIDETLPQYLQLPSDAAWDEYAKKWL